MWDKNTPIPEGWIKWKRKISEANSKSVLQFSKDGIFIREFKSIKDVENELQINHSSISLCCQGKRKSVCNFVWKYKEEKTDI